MAAGRPGFLRRFFRFLWSLLDHTRRLVVNLLFLAIVVTLLFIWLTESKLKIDENTALVVAPRGRIVEQYTGSSFEIALAEALSGEERETQLRDVLDALDAAAGDKKITRAVLVLDEFDGAGLATLREVAAALGRFRASGKQVVAWGSSFDQRQYFLAAHAGEVYLHPYGTVLLRGFGGWRNYYREALDKLGVSINVFRAGKFKSFAEPFTQNAPSKEAQEDEALWLNDAWAIYMADVESARNLPAGHIAKLIEELPQRFAAAGGDAAKLALEEKLVDGLKTRDELRALIENRGARDERRKSFRQVALGAYVSALPEESRGPAVGVVVAQGEIIDGEAPQGLVGARTTSELIRRAREDDQIKALVLRVDSPGGVLFGSEVIRRELELTRGSGKPVVVSMGDTAASGGYWISMAADQVLADAATITGSIGVFALLPNATAAWDKLGLHTGGVTTTWLAGAADPRRPLDKRVGDLIQAAIDQSYSRFIGTVAAARNLPRAKLDPVAQGRVWTGRQAQERGLVDGLGGLTDAINSAAERAKLGDEYRVVYIEREAKGIDRLLSVFFGELTGKLRAEVARSLVSASSLKAAQEVWRDLKWIRQDAMDPMTTYVHCLCVLR